MDGRVIIVVEGTPFALVLPTVYQDFWLTTEDYFIGFWHATLLRGVRLFAALVAPFLPGLYIALTSFNPELLPTELAISIAGSRQLIPFPALFEVLVLEVFFQILSEASLRMPAQIAGTLGVVGGIILGQAAVDAGIVSSLMIIVISLTAIATFVPPSLDIGITLRTLRLLFIVVASMFGVWGMTILAMVVMGHLVSLTSFGVPYLAPISPLRLEDLRDSLFWRSPLRWIRRRPTYLQPMDSTDEGSYRLPMKGPRLGGED